MYALFKCELKKIISKRNLIMYMSFVIIVLMYLIITMILNNPITDEYNQTHYGFQEIKSRVVAETYPLTDEKVKECFKKAKSIFSDAENFDNNGFMKANIYANNFAKIEGLSNLLIQVYSPIGTFDPTIFIDKEEKDITLFDFYNSRNDKVQTLLENSYYNEKEKIFIMDKTVKLKTANTRFGNTKSMNQILKNNRIVNLFILIFCCILISPVFARESQLKFSPLLKSTKLGRTKDIWAKIIASMIVVISMYISITFISILIQFCVFGINDFSLPIQADSEFWLSIFPYTFQKALTMSISLDLIATISFSCMVLLISSLSKKDYIALLISFATLFIPKFLYDSNICKCLMNLSPIKTIDFSNYLRSFDNIVYSLFDYQVLNVKIAFLVNILFVIVFIFICFVWSLRNNYE